MRGGYNQSDYTYYVVLSDGQIESGWSYRTDAQEHLKDNRPDLVMMGAAVYPKSRLRGMGVDPDKDRNWSSGVPEVMRIGPRQKRISATLAPSANPRPSRRTTGPTHTRYIGDAAVRIEHLGHGEYDSEISLVETYDDTLGLTESDIVIWEAPIKVSLSGDPDDPEFIDRLAASAIHLAMIKGKGDVAKRLRRATASAGDENSGYEVERANPDEPSVRRRKRMTLEQFQAAGGDTHQWREFIKKGYLVEVSPGVAEITQKMLKSNPAGLTAKGERMYEHIKESYGSDPRAKEIAARTVLARAGEGAVGLKKNPSKCKHCGGTVTGTYCGSCGRPAGPVKPVSLKETERLINLARSERGQPPLELRVRRSR